MDSLALDETLVSNIKAGTFNNSSYFGYKSKILKSGICKYYRRKQFDKFEWCVVEMMLFGLKNKGLLTNVLNRLKIVLMEEIICYEIGEIYECVQIFNKIDSGSLELDDKIIKVLEICSIIKHVRRGRIVSYMSCWWKYHKNSYDLNLVTINKVKKYSKKNDTDELLKYGELFIHFLETKDEKLFDIYLKLYFKTGTYGSRYRRKDGVFLLFEIVEDKYKSNKKFMKVFEFIKTMFFRKGMIERRAFGIWLMMIVWKFDVLDFDNKYVGIKLTKPQLKSYMESRTKISINEDYVVKDYHISKKFGLAGFGNHGSKVIGEDLSILGSNGVKYRQLYVDDKNGKVKPSKKLTEFATIISKNVIESGLSSFIKSKKKATTHPKKKKSTSLKKKKSTNNTSTKIDSLLFSEKHENKYLKGYVQKKPTVYKTLDNAITNSVQHNDVGGITYSKKKKFTLRKGKELLNSHSGEASWLGKSVKKKTKFNVKTLIVKEPSNEGLLKYFNIKPMTTLELKSILQLPQGQKLTSTSKKSVYMGETHVYKGPFSAKDIKLINNIKFTLALEMLEKICDIPMNMHSLLKFDIKEKDGYYFVVYKNIGNIVGAQAEEINTTIISKSFAEMSKKRGESKPSKLVKIFPRGVIKRISDIINLYPDKFTNDIKLATLQHLYLRYLLNIGDSGTQNVLYREDGNVKLVAGIDMEEIRGKDQGNTKLEYLFNSRYNKKIALFRDSIEHVVPVIKDKLDVYKKSFLDIGINVDDIKKKIDKFNSSKSKP